ncbi:TetR/AcrR family transcriptional regulator [Altererythrobacter sp. MTPC7]|uniref:TetR/AcrR family transcriptional regulator n=1 Tax=Altererythrobacter sp. MTPC7 TaxID=3056567 RepID=UPI0036F3917B
MSAERKSKKRQDILAGAQRVFVREGFDGASMEEIAREAKVAKPTLYNHFRDKSSLYVAVVEDALTKTRDAILPPSIRDLPAKEAIKLLAQRLTIMFGRDDDVLKLCRICIGGYERFPLGSSTFMQHGPRRGTDQVSELIELWRDRGEVSCTDPKIAAQQLSEMCKVGIWDPRLYAERDKVPLEECERVAEEAVLTFMARYFT